MSRRTRISKNQTIANDECERIAHRAKRNGLGIRDLGIRAKGGGRHMLKSGTRIIMTKGYKGVKGVVTGRTDSKFEFHIIKLDNGIHIIVGPSAFIQEKNSQDRDPSFY